MGDTRKKIKAAVVFIICMAIWLFFIIGILGHNVVNAPPKEVIKETEQLTEVPE